MDRTTLKYIAAAAMVLDHLGAIFLSIRTPFGLFCRIVGRLTAPVMCFFLAEGFSRTSSRSKYLLRMAVFALIAQPAYSLAFHHRLWSWDMNMLFTMLLSLLALTALEEVSSPWPRRALILGLIVLSYWSDWMIIGPVWVLLFYLLRRDRGAQIRAFALSVPLFVSFFMICSLLRRHVWQWEFIQLGTLAAIPLILSYNGEKGSGRSFHKWFFYLFYPAHLYLYALIDRLI